VEIKKRKTEIKILKNISFDFLLIDFTNSTQYNPNESKK
jgi:hypothetical protein